MVASIKPIHSLVAAVMADVGEPKLLITGAESPHTYNLRPSEARALSQADLVFWIGEDFGAVPDQVDIVAAAGGRAVSLAEAEGIKFLEVREGGVWPTHEHEDHDDDGHAEHDHGEERHAEEEHDDHGHAGEGSRRRRSRRSRPCRGGSRDHASHDEEHAHEDHDLHLWLGPDNARAMTRAIVAALSAADATNAARYQANGSELLARIDRLDAELDAHLAPVKTQPYIVFHDAYQYFERHYGTSGVGAIAVSPERTPGARRLSALRDKILELNAVCCLQRTAVRAGVGGNHRRGHSREDGRVGFRWAPTWPAGPASYFALMRGLADAFVECLTPNS